MVLLLVCLNTVPETLWGHHWSQSNTSYAKYSHDGGSWCLWWELYHEQILKNPVLFHPFWCKL